MRFQKLESQELDLEPQELGVSLSGSHIVASQSSGSVSIASSSVFTHVSAELGAPTASCSSVVGTAAFSSLAARIWSRIDSEEHLCNSLHKDDCEDDEDAIGPHKLAINCSLQPKA